MKKVILLLLMAATALAATAQSPYNWNRLDTLIGEAQYATAYPLAQKYYRGALAAGNGPDVLTAAFYLTTLDYAYSKDANDSAIMRYKYLVRQLKGVDRAVAYTFLFDTYNSLYSKNYWRIERNKPSDDPNQRIYFWDHGNDSISIDPTLMYRFYSMNEKTAYLTGYYWYSDVTVKNGWNRIAYLSSINLPLSVALADYTDFGSDGDIIKSQDEFAVLNVIGENKVWKGTLKFMEASKGYMMKRNGDESVIFSYPLYYSDNRYTGKTDASTSRSMRRVNTANTMNIVASVSGVEVEEGDLLVVYCGADRVSEASADEEGNYYLNIGRDTKEKETLTFCIERNGELMAMTDSRIVYEPNNVLGTPDKPTDINFLDLRQMPADGKWYNTAGVQLPGQPTRPGLYIYNGKVKLIK